MATNPKAQVRPIHRPPRTPADRHPHCAWTVIIDESYPEVSSIPALDIVASEPLDVVLMDVQMSIMDGMEATRRIRRRAGPTAAVPILALTANVMGTERDRYLASGMNLCLTKPIIWRDLFAALADVASGSLPSARQVAPVDEASWEAGYAHADGPLLNLELLEGMARTVPTAVYKKLLARGLDGAVESSNLLQAAGDDRIRLQQLAHRLRGTAGTFGLARISVLAGLIEERASRGEDVADLITELERVVQITRTAVCKFDVSA